MLSVELKHLLESHPRNSRTKDALVDLCLIGIKQDNPEEVLEIWDQIRTSYGNDPVASDAYNIVEPLLIERGLLDNLPPAVGLMDKKLRKGYLTRLLASLLTATTAKHCHVLKNT